MVGAQKCWQNVLVKIAFYFGCRIGIAIYVDDGG